MKSPVYFADKRCFEVPFICTSNGTGRNRQGSESFLRFLYECHPEAVSAAEGPMHLNGSEPHGAKQVPVRLLPCGQSLRAGSPLSWTACVASHPASVGMTLKSKDCQLLLPRNLLSQPLLLLAQLRRKVGAKILRPEHWADFHFLATVEGRPLQPLDSLVD